jgi:hypothetical protein
VCVCVCAFENTHHERTPPHASRAPRPA